MIIGMEIKPSKANFVTRDAIVAVGILSGNAVHPGNKRKKLGKNPATIAQVAAYNEFGTKTKTGQIIMHPRPFIRNSVGSIEAHEKMDVELADAIQKIHSGEADESILPGIIGTWGVSAIQNEMVRLGVVDTGITKRHISWIASNDGADI